MKEYLPDFGRCREITEEKKEKFELFTSLLLEYNARFNLTSIVEREQIYYKHFLDSLAGEGLFKQGAKVAEVGSGAGFPSIPLMIARPDLKFTLIESTGKKCEFLRVAVRELGLNAEVLSARAEDVGRDVTFRETFDICCARAVARLNSLAEYCMPLVKKGGLFIAYKGNAEEVEEGKHAVSVLGGGTVHLASYELPEGYGARTLVAIEKIKPTPSLYPRGNGAERKKPL